MEIVLMESAIEKLAWVLGGKASDIVDNQTDHIKTFYAPVGLGAVQEFNVQLEQCPERF
ncbi:MAG: hypothetical protein HQ591_07615 [candidate division Zixibacteria bacterium]|nr:hypothetical protein [Candidatus Tariuqbacter arcticus]